MLCSILMPTRGKPVACLNSMFSYWGNASEDKFEILLKLDSDDFEKYSPILVRNVSAVINNRGNGYKDLTRYYLDLIALARGRFCWIANDDALVSGQWISALEKVQEHAVVYPEFHGLNSSKYRHDGHGAFPCFNTQWFKYNFLRKNPIRSGDPIDEAIYLKREELHLPAVFMEGVTIQHNRNVSPEEERARA